ncbi:hypothetical protein [Campylobacter vulpis]|uniref:hypothetical protein n=1 Tax=Campylobacter vulpis TaxID=1655500 RepID=UPI001BCA7610|nr:hypothetical protein [Campylobacter vulpis]
MGNYSYLSSTINLTNKPSKNQTPISTENLQYCLLSKGLNFNTHHQYFKCNDYVLKGKISEIPQELFNDAIAFSLFFKNCAFVNKAVTNGGGGGNS